MTFTRDSVEFRPQATKSFFLSPSLIVLFFSSTLFPISYSTRWRFGEIKIYDNFFAPHAYRNGNLWKTLRYFFRLNSSIIIVDKSLNVYERYIIIVEKRSVCLSYIFFILVLNYLNILLIIEANIIHLSISI